MEKLTKQTILECSQLTTINGSILEPEQAYQVIKLKRLIKNLINQINEEIQDVYSNTFSPEEIALITKVETNSGTKEDIEKYQGLIDRIIQAKKTIDVLFKDTVDIDFTPFTFTIWHIISRENHLKLGAVECDLENIIFSSPNYRQ